MNPLPSKNQGASDFLKIPIIFGGVHLCSAMPLCLSLQILTILPNLPLNPSMVLSASHNAFLPILASSVSHSLYLAKCGYLLVMENSASKL